MDFQRKEHLQISDNLENVRFEEGTTQIAANLFHDCTGLKQIVVPDTVTVNETNAFQGCSNLYNITIPQTVTEIRTMLLKDVAN